MMEYENITLCVIAIIKRNMMITKHAYPDLLQTHMVLNR